MSDKKTPEEVLKMYAEQQEQQSGVNNAGRVSPAEKVRETATTKSEEFAQNVRESLENKASLREAQEARREEILDEQRKNHMGYINLPVQDLPTGGIFYPEGTKISVRAASGADIRHWSMINESSLMDIDNALNYIVERCVTISIPDGIGSWKDLKEIDRLYVLLAVRDFTFTDGKNELKVVINESDDIVVKKDSINFIDIPDKLMKYYNATKRCFTVKSTNPATGELNFYLPTVGVNQWLKDYVQRKQQKQEEFDKDFLGIAPMLIGDYRQLDDRSYTQLYQKTASFGLYDWSLIAKFQEIFKTIIEPKITYVDKGGVEQTTPLNFRGGIKSLFLLNMDDILDL